MAVQKPTLPYKETDPEIQKIVQRLNSVEFGTVTLIVQNGILVQIETCEKERLR